MEASVPVRKKEYFEPGECPVPLYLWGIKRVPVPITVDKIICRIVLMPFRILFLLFLRQF